METRIQQRNVNKMLTKINHNIKCLKEINNQGVYDYVYNKQVLKTIPKPFNPIKKNDMCLADYLKSIETKKPKKK